jgi:hypothetical protein
MTPGLYRIAASLLLEGLQPAWVHSLKAEPQNWRKSGLKRGGLRTLQVNGAIRRIKPQNRNLPATWTAGGAYPAFVRAVDVVGERMRAQRGRV